MTQERIGKTTIKVPSIEQSNAHAEANHHKFEFFSSMSTTTPTTIVNATSRNNEKRISSKQKPRY